jgi:hypothetical protein
MQAGHIDPEHRDRPRPPRPHDLVQPWRDRVQRPPDPVILERIGAMPKTSSTAHSLAQSSTRSSGRGLKRRLAISASITCPWVTRATSWRIGQVRSTIPATSSRRQNSATTGSAPSSFSTLGGP